MKASMCIELGMVLLLSSSLQPVTGQPSWNTGNDGTLFIPLEKIILQTDRNLYMAGENIWFTAFYNIINTNDPTPLSHVLYVELFNSRKESIIREKFTLEEGRASGCLTLPPEIATDMFILRAYTNFQRNFVPESYAMVCLTVVNPEIPYRSAGSNESEDVVIVPEGGSFIQGITCRAAVWINTRTKGNVKIIQVQDQSGQVVCPVTCLPNGLGHFEMTPVDSLDYYLYLVTDHGDTLLESFPSIEHSGFLPRIEKTPTGVVYHLEGTFPFSPQHTKGYTLSVKSSEMITLKEIPVHPEVSPMTLAIPHEYLYPGLTYLVLKDGSGQVLHVLPVYIPVSIAPAIAIKGAASSYHKRGRVNFDLIQDTNPGESFHLAISVVKQGTYSSSPDILPTLYLQHPYLLNTFAHSSDASNPAITEQADLCMILYTPFVNSTLFQANLHSYEHPGLPFLPEIRDVSISGQVTDRNTGKPGKDITVFLSVLGQSQIHMTTTNEQGQFISSLNNLTGNQLVFLWPKSGSSQSREIQIFQDFSNVYPEPLALVPDIDSSYRKLLEEMWINAQLDHPITAPDIPDTMANAARFLFTDKRLKVVLSDYIELASLYEVFWEIVPYVQVRKKKDHYTMQVINDRMEVFDDPLILLDDVPVHSVDELMKIPPALVDRIEVINEPYIHGDFVLNGVVMVYTKTENFAGMRFPGGSVFLDYQAITPTAGFPAMDYEDEEKRESRRPDFRNLLYWNPGIILSGQPATISFFTSDHTGDYEVIVRGFNAGGVPCFGTASLKVLPE